MIFFSFFLHSRNQKSRFFSSWQGFFIQKRDPYALKHPASSEQGNIRHLEAWANSTNFIQGGVFSSISNISFHRATLTARRVLGLQGSGPKFLGLWASNTRFEMYLRLRVAILLEIEIALQGSSQNKWWATEALYIAKGYCCVFLMWNIAFWVLSLNC